ncbi:uncharacterized protein BJ171DRAFT_503959 [Polychytrium aggregatum]|uniref:uncharacterized protein n=1 Tax=Polychytrium aggregatum TaxID=110093 RepID=UPI0022FEAC31|nr:uncharacterized protein BJ171DRAFT_503959 [Polychytrium aggregatum]KAI9204891.1 hypothetical protein BJ171DRAFT_503959 [Polychytrium aggregatum]
MSSVLPTQCTIKDPIFGLILAIRRGERLNFPISKFEFTIGKDKSCNLRLHCEHASGKHCTIIIRDNAKVWLRDHSDIGTLVNNVLYRNEETLLNNKDSIIIDGSQFCVVFFHDIIQTYQSRLAGQSDANNENIPLKAAQLEKPEAQTLSGPHIEKASTAKPSALSSQSVVERVKDQPLIKSHPPMFSPKRVAASIAPTGDLIQFSPEPTKVDLISFSPLVVGSKTKTDLKPVDDSRPKRAISNSGSGGIAQPLSTASQANVVAQYPIYPAPAPRPEPTLLPSQCLPLQSAFTKKAPVSVPSSTPSMIPVLRRPKTPAAAYNSTVSRTMMSAQKGLQPQVATLPKSPADNTEGTKFPTSIVPPSSGSRNHQMSQLLGWHSPSGKSAMPSSPAAQHTVGVQNMNASQGVVAEVTRRIEASFKSPDKSAKKKGVTFGPQLSPEVFDKDFPTASPLKRGARTPRSALIKSALKTRTWTPPTRITSPTPQRPSPRRPPVLHEDARPELVPSSSLASSESSLEDHSAPAEPSPNLLDKLMGAQGEDALEDESCAAVISMVDCGRAGTPPPTWSIEVSVTKPELPTMPDFSIAATEPIDHSSDSSGDSSSDFVITLSDRLSPQAVVTTDAEAEPGPESVAAVLPTLPDSPPELEAMGTQTIGIPLFSTTTLVPASFTVINQRRASTSSSQPARDASPERSRRHTLGPAPLMFTTPTHPEYQGAHRFQTQILDNTETPMSTRPEAISPLHFEIGAQPSNVSRDSVSVSETVRVDQYFVPPEINEASAGIDGSDVESLALEPTPLDDPLNNPFLDSSVGPPISAQDLSLLVGEPLQMQPLSPEHSLISVTHSLGEMPDRANEVDDSSAVLPETQSHPHPDDAVLRTPPKQLVDGNRLQVPPSSEKRRKKRRRSTKTPLSEAALAAQTESLSPLVRSNPVTPGAPERADMDSLAATLGPQHESMGLPLEQPPLGSPTRVSCPSPELPTQTPKAQALEIKVLEISGPEVQTLEPQSLECPATREPPAATESDYSLASRQSEPQAQPSVGSPRGYGERLPEESIGPVSASELLAPEQLVQQQEVIPSTTPARDQTPSPVRSVGTPKTAAQNAALSKKRSKRKSSMAEHKDRLELVSSPTPGSSSTSVPESLLAPSTPLSKKRKLDGVSSVPIQAKKAVPLQTLTAKKASSSGFDASKPLSMKAQIALAVQNFLAKRSVSSTPVKTASPLSPLRLANDTVASSDPGFVVAADTSASTSASTSSRPRITEEAQSGIRAEPLDTKMPLGVAASVPAVETTTPNTDSPQAARSLKLSKRRHQSVGPAELEKLEPPRRLSFMGRSSDYPESSHSDTALERAVRPEIDSESRATGSGSSHIESTFTVMSAESSPSSSPSQPGAKKKRKKKKRSSIMSHSLSSDGGDQPDQSDQESVGLHGADTAVTESKSRSEQPLKVPISASVPGPGPVPVPVSGLMPVPGPEHVPTEQSVDMREHDLPLPPPEGTQEKAASTDIRQSPQALRAPSEAPSTSTKASVDASHVPTTTPVDASLVAEAPLTPTPQKRRRKKRKSTAFSDPTSSQPLGLEAAVDIVGTGDIASAANKSQLLDMGRPDQLPEEGHVDPSTSISEENSPAMSKAVTSRVETPVQPDAKLPFAPQEANVTGALIETQVEYPISTKPGLVSGEALHQVAHDETVMQIQDASSPNNIVWIGTPTDRRRSKGKKKRKSTEGRSDQNEMPIGHDADLSTAFAVEDAHPVQQESPHIPSPEDQPIEKQDNLVLGDSDSAPLPTHRSAIGQDYPTLGQAEDVEHAATSEIASQLECGAGHQAREIVDVAKVQPSFISRGSTLFREDAVAQSKADRKTTPKATTQHNLSDTAPTIDIAAKRRNTPSQSSHIQTLSQSLDATDAGAFASPSSKTRKRKVAATEAAASSPGRTAESVEDHRRAKMPRRDPGQRSLIASEAQNPLPDVPGHEAGSAVVTVATANAKADMQDQSLGLTAIHEGEKAQAFDPPHDHDRPSIRPTGVAELDDHHPSPIQPKRRGRPRKVLADVPVEAQATHFVSSSDAAQSSLPMAAAADEPTLAAEVVEAMLQNTTEATAMSLPAAKRRGRPRKVAVETIDVKPEDANTSPPAAFSAAPSTPEKQEHPRRAVPSEENLPIVAEIAHEHGAAEHGAAVYSGATALVQRKRGRSKKPATDVTQAEELGEHEHDRDAEQDQTQVPAATQAATPTPERRGRQRKTGAQPETEPQIDTSIDAQHTTIADAVTAFLAAKKGTLPKTVADTVTNVAIAELTAISAKASDEVTHETDPVSVFKKRGRPKRNANPEPPETESTTSLAPTEEEAPIFVDRLASPGPKRRGRPRKIPLEAPLEAHLESGIERIAEEVPPTLHVEAEAQHIGLQEHPAPITSPQPRRRGRPKKNTSAEASVSEMTQSVAVEIAHVELASEEPGLAGLAVQLGSPASKRRGRPKKIVLEAEAVRLTDSTEAAFQTQSPVLSPAPRRRGRPRKELAEAVPAPPATVDSVEPTSRADSNAAMASPVPKKRGRPRKVLAEDSMASSQPVIQETAIGEDPAPAPIEPRTRSRSRRNIGAVATRMEEEGDESHQSDDTPAGSANAAELSTATYPTRKRKHQGPVGDGSRASAEDTVAGAIINAAQEAIGDPEPKRSRRGALKSSGDGAALDDSEVHVEVPQEAVGESTTQQRTTRRGAQHTAAEAASTRRSTRRR